jgi:hypothetical protein
MAQKVHIVLVDDLDGSDASQTVSFGLDGTSYAAALRDSLSGYVGHARKVGSSARRRKSAATSGPGASEIREWAKANNMKVSDRGRVSAEVRQAYDAAH